MNDQFGSFWVVLEGHFLDGGPHCCYSMSYWFRGSHWKNLNESPTNWQFIVLRPVKETGTGRSSRFSDSGCNSEYSAHLHESCRIDIHAFAKIEFDTFPLNHSILLMRFQTCHVDKEHHLTAKVFILCPWGSRGSLLVFRAR